MKQILDLRPVHHPLEERIRAHVVLCWLALLLIRIIETSTGDTWHHVRRDLDRLHVGTFTGPTGLLRQRTNCPSPNATCSPASTSLPRSRSSNSPRAADQRRQHPLETRRSGVSRRIPQLKPYIAPLTLCGTQDHRRPRQHTRGSHPSSSRHSYRPLTRPDRTYPARVNRTRGRPA